MKVGIIGGGLMGLSLARHLAVKGNAVTVFEQEKQLGGLTTYHNYGPFYWDRFYHVILPSDTHLIRFLKDIGLGEKLRWSRTLTGFYVDQRFHSLSSTLDFLRFPPLSLLSKFRLALGILYCARISDWKKLETILVENWLLHIFGRRIYDKIWKPLLLAKLGESYKRVSAVFIWSNMKRMYSARDSSAKKEQMGYVSGGYRVVFNRLEELICCAGGKILTQTSVKQVYPCPEGGLCIDYNTHKEHFDRIVFTGPVNVLQRIASDRLVTLENNNGRIDYLGVICMVLVTKSPLTPYYVLNIADDRIPFTGIIGMSNLISKEETAGFHLTYLPKYVHSSDPLLTHSDAELFELFINGLRVMFPRFREEEIEQVHINRASKVQPLQVLNYSSMAPRVVTQHKDFCVLNTAQFSNSTLNNNEVIRAVDEFMMSHC